eukprot:1112650-Rhodomonas_salina.2
MGTSNPRVTNCALSSCESCCIRVMGSASGIFADNKLSDAGDACFWAGGDSSSAFTHNMVGATHGCGVLLEENTRVRVENNDISSGLVLAAYARHQNGIQAGDNADPFVQVTLYDVGSMAQAAITVSVYALGMPCPVLTYGLGGVRTTPSLVAAGAESCFSREQRGRI